MKPTINVTITTATFFDTDVTYNDSSVLYSDSSNFYGGSDAFSEPHPYFTDVDTLLPHKLVIDQMKPTIKEVETF